MAYLAQIRLKVLSIWQKCKFMSLKNVRCIHKTCFVTFFYYFGVYHIAENFLFFLQLVEVIWKTAANQGVPLTKTYAEKYEEVSALYRIKFDYM